MGAKQSMLQDIWQECSLPQQEMPSYDFFANAYEGHYNLTLENAVACAVKDYACKTDLEGNEWSLRRIYSRDGIYHAFVDSETGNELYLLLEEGDLYPRYIIAADIRKNGDADILLQDESYSYYSMLQWHSYEKWMNGEADMKDAISINITEYLYDSIYSNGCYYAVYDYLSKSGEGMSDEWKIDENMEYIGRNGYIADIFCVSEKGRMGLLVDVWNHTYAVMETSLSTVGSEGSGQNASTDNRADFYLQKIEEYRKHFIGLYTEDAWNGTSRSMNIEEKEIFPGSSEGAALTAYIDAAGNCLRYELRAYSEMGNTVINYYLCDGFTLVSRQTNHYSSWVLSAGYSDILYSDIENWIITDEMICILHDNGELEEIEEEQLGVPLLEELVEG